MGLPKKRESESLTESESEETQDSNESSGSGHDEDEEFVDAEAGTESDGDDDNNKPMEVDMEQEHEQSVQLFDSEEAEGEEEEEEDVSRVPDAYQGMLYAERYKSFTIGGWPASADEGQENNNIKCSRHELAMAGLEFSGEPGQAKCVVCHRVVTGLKDNSNPWKAHKAVNPKCPLILVGRPNKPNGYTMEKFIHLVGERQCQFLEYQFQEYENRVKNMLKILVAEEMNGNQ